VTARSYLYVPGDRLDRLGRAFDRGADEIIIDLEDSVPPGAKPGSLAALRAWLPAAPRPVWIRINPQPLGERDVAELAGAPKVAGLCLAKTENAGWVCNVARALDDAGSGAMLAPLLESAVAVLDARQIAAAPRVARLQLGEADLRAQLGITPSGDERELLAVRGQVVLASAAAGLAPPLAPVSTNFADLDTLAESTAALHRLGFFGRACIHPAQIPVVNREFTPTRAAVDAARRTIGDLDRAFGAASVGPDGTMIDDAVGRQARRVVALADRVGTRD
jgi:citrate lyase subunit beta/citryl-CoA lyase